MIKSNRRIWPSLVLCELDFTPVFCFLMRLITCNSPHRHLATTRSRIPSLKSHDMKQLQLRQRQRQNNVTKTKIWIHIRSDAILRHLPRCFAARPIFPKLKSHETTTPTTSTWTEDVTQTQIQQRQLGHNKEQSNEIWNIISAYTNCPLLCDQLCILHRKPLKIRKSYDMKCTTSTWWDRFTIKKTEIQQRPFGQITR